MFCIITRDRFIHVFGKDKGGFMDFDALLQQVGPGAAVSVILFESSESAVTFRTFVA